MKTCLIAALIPLFFACSPDKKPAQTPARPNIIILLADDLGYADLGCFGSDIATPNIDRLAASGLVFTRFHTAATCAPTRAMLLSGNDNHIAGMGSQFRKTGEWGYEGHLTDRIATIPQLLRDNGYHTYMAGKWHLGAAPEFNPHSKGFEQSFALLPGAGNHYDNKSVLGGTVSRYTENGEPTDWPQGAYSTQFYTDKLIEYIGRNKGDGKPFFAYAAFTSPHWPLQVDSAYWTKYQGRYDSGYEALRQENLRRLQKTGFIQPDAVLPPLHPGIAPWDSLTADQQRTEARKMELYAGMVDNLDHNIGRLIQYLKEIGEYDNTLIVFMSDNGAAGEDFFYKGQFAEYAQANFNNDYDNMGKPNSYVSYGPQWAEAGSAPFRYYKEYTTEGGTTAPMIITGPGIKRPHEMVNGFASLLDLAPTFYELAGVYYPDTLAYPLKGRSMAPLLAGNSDVIHPDTDVYTFEQSGHLVIRQGDWKLVNEGYPLDTARFRLFNLAGDLGETVDLSDRYPEKRAELLRIWAAYRAECRILDGEAGELD
ncbi:MAG TPA: arylsulfatase [Flavilitoribacter sp.]|nr:arylsulfatase [Flavilitoribacter sp.]